MTDRQEEIMRNMLIAALGMLMTASLAVGQTVTVSLESPQNGLTLAPGTTVEWTIKTTVSTGDNAGLALLVCDLVQDPNNPAKFDIPPAALSSVDATMAQFSRPAGICNPGETVPTSGYTGVQRGTPGAMNLVQIGGSQNTFGLPGATMGQDVNVLGGIGQSGPQVVAGGSFPAPGASGTYIFRVANVLANVLESISAPPSHSPVRTATTTLLNDGVITFAVGPQYCLGDLNCDNQVSFVDINAFVLYLSNFTVWQTTYAGCSAKNGDINDDGTYPSFSDINAFVTLLSTNSLPIICP